MLKMVVMVADHGDGGGGAGVVGGFDDGDGGGGFADEGDCDDGDIGAMVVVDKVMVMVVVDKDAGGGIDGDSN